ncbi:hypothetical protein SGLAD_v1c07800 [Spiroplasma gladiatoris]|uniref:Uncharacterized protein n=1 Tax=Spiroplasma gladiatoris TaxID=2143 RepID=A0A4V1AQC1_9MOLU|nr:hypothetical protein [Spiroplasma gladiatoris]QBQ07979.1 hypothetical protein SGLAD_v1c07800 [Spiroplasma gladiatoris]
MSNETKLLKNSINKDISKKEKINHYLKKSFYIWATFVPFFAIILDLFLSIIQADPKNGTSTINFDFSLINQLIYLSTWISMASFAYGLLNWINLDHKNMPSWISNKNNLTRVTTLNLIMFLVYNLTSIIDLISGSNNIVGFNNWYKILKSVLEHMISPLMFIMFYFWNSKEIIATKTYVKKYSWYNFLMIAIYSLFISIRAIFLNTYYPQIFNPDGQTIGGAFTPFPYGQISPIMPDNKPIIITIMGILGLLISVWLIAIFLNFISNLFIKKIIKNNNIK